jgi:hypothetical protein
VTRRAKRASNGKMEFLANRRHVKSGAVLAAVLALSSLDAVSFRAQTVQQSSPKNSQAEVQTPKAGSRDAADSAPDADAVPPGDWAPELMDGILSSQNPAAAEALYDAAFAAGPGLIPQLEAALKDDRTAEFAAQALAFAGGEKAEQILQTLISDPRNLDLRRFYLGSLGEYPAPEIEQLLLNAVAKSDAEPDRTVTEAAIWALTVRSEPGLPAEIKSAETGIQDVAIREELENARQVIASRLSYLASAEGRNAGGSLEQAVRTYFIGALQEPRAGSASKTQPAVPTARFEVNRTVFSPDKSRALAHVVFEDDEARAGYDLILQKQFGDWKVVSVWEGATIDESEATSAGPAKPNPPAPRRRSATHHAAASGNDPQATH